MALIGSLEKHLLVTIQRTIYLLNLDNQSISAELVPKIEKKSTQSQNNDENVDATAAADDDDAENTEANGTTELDHINNLEISENNRLIGITTIDKYLFLYRFDDGQLSLIQQVPLVRSTSKIRFTPDGRNVLVADKTGDCYIVSCSDENPKVKWILGQCSIALDILMTKDARFVITSDRDEKIRVTNYPQTENIESYCLGHLEYVSGIEQLPDGDLLVSVSGDKTIRIWNFLKGTECFQLNLELPGLHLARNHENINRFAISLIGERQQSIGIYEVSSSPESPKIHNIAEYTLEENVKHVNKIIYDSDEHLFILCHSQENAISVKSFRVEGTSLILNENETTVVMNLLKDNVAALNAPLSIDISMLFKKKFDENQVIEYFERKKKRLEEQKTK